MKSFLRSALLGATGLVALSLSAHAAGATAVTDTPLFKSTTTQPMQLAQRNENPGGGMFRNENPGACPKIRRGMAKKSSKKKAKKK